MAPRPTLLAVIANKLVDAMTLANDKGEEKHGFASISYFPNGKQMIGASTDNSSRRWDLQTSEEIVEPRLLCEQAVRAVAVSMDSRWIITGGGDWDDNAPGELKACEVETGMMKTFEGHSRIVSAIDISMDNKLLASGFVRGSREQSERELKECISVAYSCTGLLTNLKECIYCNQYYSYLQKGWQYTRGKWFVKNKIKLPKKESLCVSTIMLRVSGLCNHVQRPSRRVTAFTTTNMPFHKISRDVKLAAVNIYEHEHQNQCPPQSLSLHLCRDACSPFLAVSSVVVFT